MINVAVGIIIQENRVLLCQRKRTARYALKWEFPGGKVEAGEQIDECLKRELHEELGIDATIGELYYRQSYQYQDSGTFDVFYHMVHSYAGELINHVFESFQWVPINELTQFDILEGNRTVVQRLMEEAFENRPGKG